MLDLIDHDVGCWMLMSYYGRGIDAMTDVRPREGDEGHLYLILASIYLT